MGNLLVPFKKFLSNKNTITILGVLVGLVVLYLGYTWRVNQSIQPTSIPYCNKTLLQKTKITLEDISYADVPKDLLDNMDNVITNVDQIVGKLVSYDAKIPQNSFFYKESMIKEEEMPNSIFSSIPDGYTIYDLNVDNKKTYANSIMPDTTIDLYLKSESEEGLLMYGRLIKEIRVLAARDNSGNNAFADKDNPIETTHLLFAVPENLFLLLKKAENLGITIEPVPRNDNYTNNATATELTNEELQLHIISQTYQLSNECVDLTIC